MHLILKLLTVPARSHKNGLMSTISRPITTVAYPDAHWGNMLATLPISRPVVPWKGCGFDFTAFLALMPKTSPIHEHPDFLAWLCGFADSEGSWFVDARGGIKFSITQHRGDIGVLYMVQATLGFGRVYMAGPNAAQFVVFAKAEVVLISVLFAGNLVLSKKRKQFDDWLGDLHAWQLKTDYLDIIAEPRVHTATVCLESAWLAGFMSGDGGFYVQHNNGKFDAPVAALSQSDCPELLGLLKPLFPHIHTTQSANGAVLYRVSGVRNAPQVISYYTRFPLCGSKEISFIRWLAIVDKMRRGAHLDKTLVKALGIEAALVNRLKTTVLAHDAAGVAAFLAHHTNFAGFVPFVLSDKVKAKLARIDPTWMPP
jgi:hypothetical protein